MLTDCTGAVVDTVAVKLRAKGDIDIFQISEVFFIKKPGLTECGDRVECSSRTGGEDLLRLVPVFYAVFQASLKGKAEETKLVPGIVHEPLIMHFHHLGRKGKDFFSLRLFFHHKTNKIFHKTGVRLGIVV